ncbi:MAG: ribonuclease HI family protein [Acidobacteriaceae bacterium]
MSSLFEDPKKPAADAQDVLIAFIDGGSRGNPGPAAYGVYLQDANGKCVDELCEFLGVKTNNVAEYSALLAALRYAIEKEFRDLQVVSDSELLVKQMQGRYRVNSPDLRPLYEEARRMVQKLSSFSIRHVLRAKNKEADRLANVAMDRGMKMRGGGGEQIRGNAYERKPEAAKPPLLEELDGVIKDGVVEIYGRDLPEGTKVKVRVVR